MTVKHINGTKEFSATDVRKIMAVFQMDLSSDTLFDVLVPYCYYFTEYEMTQ